MIANPPKEQIVKEMINSEEWKSMRYELLGKQDTQIFCLKYLTIYIFLNYFLFYFSLIAREKFINFKNQNIPLIGDPFGNIYICNTEHQKIIHISIIANLFICFFVCHSCMRKRNKDQTFYFKSAENHFNACLFSIEIQKSLVGGES